MSWFTDLFSSSVASVVDSVGNAVDKIVTSDEERETLKVELVKEMNQFKIKQLDALANYDKELTQRHTSDMMSDSFLSKNIRPMTLAFLTVTTILLAYTTIFILPVEKVELIEPWLDMLQMMLITTYAFYFGSRGFEKIEAMRGKRSA